MPTDAADPTSFSRNAWVHKTLKTLDARNCKQWREWLAKHHDSESEVWLVIHKRQTARLSIAYDDAVDEARVFRLDRQLDQAPR